MPFSTSKCNTCVFQHLSMATLGELQQRLSGDLQLLHYLRLHPARVHEKCHDKNLPPQGQKISGEILNSIALCLVTHEGTPEETTAVSIDLRGGVTLVIAKGRVPTSEDYDAAQRFFFALRTRRTWSSVICEVMSYSWQPMNTRIATLHNTVVQWMSRDPTSFRISEDPSTMELMFPGLLEVVDKSYIVDLNTNNPRLMFVRALDKVLRLSDLKIPPAAKPDDLAVEVRQFFDLCNYCSVVSRCIIWNSTDLGCTHPDRRLKRRLDKMLQYLYPIGFLLRTHYVDIASIRWVDESFDHLTTAAVQIPSPWSVMLSGREDYGSSNLPSHKSWSNKFRDVLGSWESSITLALHAELRLVLHFAPQREAKFYLPDEWTIGCSSRSCVACSRWLSGYNESHGTRWWTPRSKGRSDCTWALPAITHDCNVLENTRSALQEMLRAIEMREEIAKEVVEADF